MNLDHNLLTIQENRSLLLRNHSNCSLISYQLNQLDQHIPSTEKSARLRDYDGHEANGHRMAIYATSKLIQFANELNDPKQSLAVLKLINFILSQFARCDQLIKSDRNGNQFESPILNWREHLRLIVEYRTLREELGVVIYSGKFPSRFYTGFSWFLYWLSSQFLYQMYSVDSVRKLWPLLTSRQFRKNAVIDWLTETDLEKWAGLYIGTEAPWFKNSFGWLIRVRVPEVITEEKVLNLSSKYQITVNEDLSDIGLTFHESSINERPIRIKIYRHKSSDRKKKLVFHCHGGGKSRERSSWSYPVPVC